jgi:CRISPR system Cascade subunit CasD
MDYHTAGGTHRVDDSYGVAHADSSQPSTVTSRRYYVADADFLVGLEGNIRLLRVLDFAVTQPRWQIFLGRKSFPLSSPIRLPEALPWGPGLRAGSLEDVLAEYPWLGDFTRSRREQRPSSLRLVIDSAQPTEEVRTDVPLSFAERRFTVRYVKTQWKEFV